MFCCMHYHFLDYLVLYACIYGVHGGMHDMGLLEGRGSGVTVFSCVYISPVRGRAGSKDYCLGLGHSSDEQGQGRTTFHQFMQIWVFLFCFGFAGHTARADIAARSLFVS